MSDNDSIKRGNLKKQVLEYVRTHVMPTVTGVLALIEDAPAAPREMSAREYEKAIVRAFHSDDDAYCEWADAIDEENIDKAVAIVEKWAKEHPEERSEQ